MSLMQSEHATQENGGHRQGQGILSLSIREKAVLHAAYMPFIRNGGLFIPTTRHYEIGNEVFMLLRLLDEEEKLPVAGRVIWITPARAQSNRVAGIGVQFNDSDGVARQRIEKLLAGVSHDRPTHTL